MRLLHVVAFSKKLRLLAQTKVITLKTQLHAVNACVKRLSQRILQRGVTCHMKYTAVIAQNYKQTAITNLR